MKIDPRTILSAAMAVAVMAALTSCGGGGATASSAPAASDADAAEADVTVTATEFMFDPDTLDIEAGTETTIELVNSGGVEHDFTIDDHAMTHAGVGETARGTIEPLEPGTYEFYCSIPGHREAGMVGELTVP